MKTSQINEKTVSSSNSLHKDNREDILHRGREVLNIEAGAILDAMDRMNDTFIEAVQAIEQCSGRVCVTGVGKAGLIGQKIQATLASTGTLSYYLHPVEALHGDLGMIHFDDIVVALSKSGSSELVELLPRIKNLGCKVILLTAHLDSQATSFADMVLDIGQTPEACPLGLAPSASTASMLAIGDALALTVMELKAVRPEQYASYHPGGELGRFLMKSHEVMRTGKDCPAVMDSATLGECYEAMIHAPKRSGAAAIIDCSNKLVGIITHGDFFRMFKSPQRTMDCPIKDVMTTSPKYIGKDDRVTEAMQLMKTHAIDELPVVDSDHKLVGLIDVQDLIDRGFSV